MVKSILVHSKDEMHRNMSTLKMKCTETNKKINE